MGKIQKIKSEFASDETLSQAGRLTKRAWRELPRASLRYLSEKTPIIQWLPHYSPRWIVNDFVAGLTVGVLLIPQGLSYAKIATIPVEYGLSSSWLSPAIYAVMGTSKDLSTGPTSILGLLTAEIIAEFKADNIPPQVIASAVAFLVGVYSMFLGLFKLGFLLDYISAPVLTGFISAAAIVIMLGQVGSLLGLDNLGSGTADIIRNVFTMLPKAQWRTVLVGITGIIFLELLQFIGTKGGKKYKFLQALSIGRAAIVLVIYTGISYGVNKDLKTPLFPVSKVQSRGINPPDLPPMDLIRQVVPRAIAPLVAAALEHIAIGSAFGQKNGYAIDKSQELTYLGVTNTFNSLFTSMPVGGAMSRTAVASNASVKSPLSGLVTSGFVLLGIYKLSAALFWIPKATLAAIIVTAVYHLVGPLSLFYKFWRTSLADFVASMICFWVTLFVSAENGIAFAVAFSVAYTLVRSAFASVTLVKSNNEVHNVATGIIPSDTEVFRFDEALMFPNAQRAKTRIIENLMVHHSGLAQPVKGPDRSWSVAREKRIKYLRGREGVGEYPPPIRVVILDFARVAHLDFTGLKALGDLKTDLKAFAGKDAELRFIGLTDSAMKRFNRAASWNLIEAQGTDVIEADSVGVYCSLGEAIWAARRTSDTFPLDNEKV